MRSRRRAIQIDVTVTFTSMTNSYKFRTVVYISAFPTPPHLIAIVLSQAVSLLAVKRFLIHSTCCFTGAADASNLHNVNYFYEKSCCSILFST